MARVRTSSPPRRLTRSLVIAGVCVVAAFLVGIWTGVTFVKGDPPPPPPPPNPAPPAPAANPAGPTNSVLSHPYVRGRIAVEPERPIGVTVHTPRAFDGYNLVVSAHGAEALLMDMTGRVVHRWARRFEEVRTWKGKSAWGDGWPPPNHMGATCYRRAYLQPDGRLLVLFENLGVVMLDRDSNVLWAYCGGRPHHAADIAPDGRIYLLSAVSHYRDLGLRTFATTDFPIHEDVVVILSPDGEKLDEISIVDALRDSDFESILETAKHGDILHTNSIQVLTVEDARRNRLFRAGHVLLCFRHLHALAILDPAARRIVWTLSGMFKAQHDPTVVPEGDLLVFDNCGNGGASRVVQINPTTQQVTWRFPDRGESLLFSETCGTCQRLPNGNTLITESETGRAVEVTRDGEIAWEYYSPHRYNSRLVATLYDLHRIEVTSLRFKLQPQ